MNKKQFCDINISINNSVECIQHFTLTACIVKMPEQSPKVPRAEQPVSVFTTDSEGKFIPHFGEDKAFTLPCSESKSDSKSGSNSDSDSELDPEKCDKCGEPFNTEDCTKVKGETSCSECIDASLQEQARAQE